MKLIVGLGNPGMGYTTNRHNIGFLCLNYFAKKHGIKFEKKQNEARVGIGISAGIDVVLAKPQTFMNASGKAVNGLMQRYYLSLNDLIVVHDDLDLPLGKIRIRQDSSGGGHRGATSIIALLGSKDFVRIRVGIGRPVASEQLREQEIIDHVLGDFSREEKTIVEAAIERVDEALLCLLTQDVNNAMNKFN
jgi:PTH1 family peptidyl-tRNA hydrolase